MELILTVTSTTTSSWRLSWTLHSSNHKFHNRVSYFLESQNNNQQAYIHPGSVGVEDGVALVGRALAGDTPSVNADEDGILRNLSYVVLYEMRRSRGGGLEKMLHGGVSE